MSKLRLVILILFASISSLAAISQARHTAGENIFAAYSTPEIFAGKPAPLDLSSPDARMYRTRLRYAIRKGPRFASY